MKSSIPLVFIAILLFSCTERSDTSITASSFIPTVSASNTPEPSETEQIATSAITPTATMITGILSKDELQEQVDAWVNGEIPYVEEDRLLDEMTGESLQLGVLSDNYADSVMLLFYNLGHTVLYDPDGNPYLVNMAGFEDGARGRFAFPLHNGIISEACPTIVLEIFEGSRQINRGRSIYFDILTPADFAREAGALQGMTTVVHTFLFLWGEGNNECEKKEGEYYLEAGPVLEALANFLECDDCTIIQAPELLMLYMNEVPSAIGQIPYARIYDSQ